MRKLMTLLENDAPQRVFHGTSGVQAAKIAEAGYHVTNLFTTSSEDDASDYAYERAQEDGDHVKVMFVLNAAMLRRGQHTETGIDYARDDEAVIHIVFSGDLRPAIIEQRRFE